jgi:hypothetical protein
MKYCPFIKGPCREGDCMLSTYVYNQLGVSYTTCSIFQLYQLLLQTCNDVNSIKEKFEEG